MAYGRRGRKTAARSGSRRTYGKSTRTRRASSGVRRGGARSGGQTVRLIIQQAPASASGTPFYNAASTSERAGPGKSKF